MALTEIEIKSNPTSAQIDRAIKLAGLTATLRGTMKSYPGCTHWHCKFGKEKGTLEITVWPKNRRAWFKIQSARAAGWMAEKIAAVKQSLEHPSKNRR